MISSKETSKCSQLPKDCLIMQQVFLAYLATCSYGAGHTVASLFLLDILFTKKGVSHLRPKSTTYSKINNISYPNLGLASGYSCLDSFPLLNLAPKVG